MQDRISQVEEASCTARSKAVLVSCRLQCPVCPKGDIVDCLKGAIPVKAVVLTGVTEYWPRSRRSLQLDVGSADHLAPLLGFVGNELSELGRRSGQCGFAHFGNSRFHFGINKARIDL